MELVEVIARKNFHNTVVGEITAKQRYMLPRYLAEQFASVDLVTILNPKRAVSKIPVLLKPLAGGSETLSASLPVGQVSPQQTAKPRRSVRRKKAGESSL